MEASEILKAREEKSLLISSYIKNYQVVSLKANIPGPNKNIYLAYILVNLFNNLYVQNLNPIKTLYYESADGPYYVYLFNKDKVLKDDLIKIEETKLGRFIDLDCFYDSIVSLHRSNPRKCYICQKDAFVCNRESNHSLLEKLDFIESNIKSYLFNNIVNIIKDSALEELNLTHKFGLVSPISSGSHNDMNYELMSKSIEVISPYIASMFMCGLEFEDNSLDKLFKQINVIGLEADKAMFASTNNINTYQGLIFNLGVVSCSAGYCIKNKLSYTQIYYICGKICNGHKNNYGAVKEAKNEYRNIQKILKNYNLDTECSKREALIDLIINVEDTIFAKRCPNQQERIDLINKFKLVLESKDNQLINQLDKLCEQNHYSFGGCADLLVVAIFIKKVAYLFKNEN